MEGLALNLGKPPAARFTLRESIVVGLYAVIIVVSGMFLVLPSTLPAHKVFAVVFFLLLGRASVRRPFAATVIGLLAGLLTLYPGLSRGGPVQLVRYVAAGGVADLMFLLLPATSGSRPLGMLCGALMGATWFPAAFLMDLVVGMDTGAALQHAALKTASAMGFGVLGGLLAPSVVRRLRASGLLPPVAPPALLSRTLRG